MFASLNHPSAIKAACLCDASRTGRSDPTGTGDLVRRFRAQSDLRWRRFRSQLQMVLVQQDMLGLNPNKPTPLSLALAAMPKGNKILAFQNWVDNTLKSVVIENDSAYLDPMIDRAYRRGLSRAMRLSRTRIIPNGATNSISALQHLAFIELQGISEAVSQQLVRLASNAMIDNTSKPATVYRAGAEIVEKVGVERARMLIDTITVKSFNTGTLDQFEAAGMSKVGVVPEFVPARQKQISDYNPNHDPETGEFTSGGGGGGRVRAPSLGETSWRRLLAIGGGDPVEASRAFREIVGKVETKVKKLQTADARRRQPSRSTVSRIRRRERALERLEIVNVLTAGDDDVCPICEDIAENNPYTINQARTLIPAHIRCRCAFIPAEDERFAEVEE